MFSAKSREVVHLPPSAENSPSRLPSPAMIDQFGTAADIVSYPWTRR